MDGKSVDMLVDTGAGVFIINEGTSSEQHNKNIIFNDGDLIFIMYCYFPYRIVIPVTSRSFSSPLCHYCYEFGHHRNDSNSNDNVTFSK